MRDDGGAVSTSAKLVAGSVHLFTAGGAAAGLLALTAIGDGRWKTALYWMALAVLIDALDGPLARRFRVARALPWIDGALLDNLVDYLNYVVVPAYFLVAASLLPRGFDLPGAAMICVASAYQFTRVDAKTDQRYFRGFPCYWNLLVFYLLLLEPPRWIALSIVLVLCAMAFVPIYCVYPSRTPEYRRTTLTLSAIYAVGLGLLLVRFPEHDLRWAYGSLLYVIYYSAASFRITARRRAAQRPARGSADGFR